jgi:uncharacterized protein (TIGR01244 family)
MSAPINWLAPDFAVAPQLSPEQVRELAGLGFKSVINNRQEHESGQPPEAELRAAAAEAQLNYERQPVNPAQIRMEDVARFAELMETLPRPILAFCRSGSRSSILYRAVIERQK